MSEGSFDNVLRAFNRGDFAIAMFPEKMQASFYAELALARYFRSQYNRDSSYDPERTAYFGGELIKADLKNLLQAAQHLEINPALIFKYQDSGGRDRQSREEYEKIKKIVYEHFEVTSDEMDGMHATVAHSWFDSSDSEI